MKMRLIDEAPKYHDYFINVALKQGLCLDEANEVVQDFYLRIHKYNPSYVPNDVRGYCRMVLINVIKARWFKKNRYVLELPFDVEESESTIEHQIAMEKFILKIEDFIMQLPPHKSSVFRKWFKQNMTQKKISEISKVGKVSVFKIIKECKILIREKYGKEWEYLQRGETEKI